jgi:Cytochrome P460
MSIVSVGKGRRLLRDAALAVFVAAVLAPAAGPAEPRFDSNNELVRPEGHREWMFVGSSLGLSYQEGQQQNREPNFHNVYIQPASYQQFQKTGEFPEGTVLVMEVFSAASRESINRQGHFEGRSIGIEAAVKDSSHFPEKWAYFSFIGEGGAPKKTAKAFPQQACWQCHNEHAATDNVFTQFYPVLRKGE